MPSSPVPAARSQYLLDLLAQVPDPRKKRGRRHPLAGLLADTPWDVKGYTPKVEAALPPAYKLDSRGKVQRRT